VNENVAYGEVRHHNNINASKNKCGGIGMEKNAAYGQVSLRYNEA
jgi:hypothetical protein